MKNLLRKFEKYLVLALIFSLFYYFNGDNLISNSYAYTAFIVAVFHRTTWAILKLMLIKSGNLMAMVFGTAIGFMLYIVIFGLGRFLHIMSATSTKGVFMDQKYNLNNLKGPY